MWKQILQKRKLSLLIGGLVGAFVAVALLYLQNDIHKNYLDPKTPFQVYSPPTQPDYAKPDSWFFNPSIARYTPDPRKVDVFFVHATSFNGGKGWLGPIDSNALQTEVRRVQLSNYAGPFAVMGSIYAPKYRQASLYTQLTLREDAREARQFAYRDVEASFRAFLAKRRGGRGFVIVGVEQGGLMTERLLRDIVAPDPDLKAQLVAAYLLETLVPENQFGNPSAIVPACMSRTQTGCVTAYVSVEAGRPDLALQLLQKAVYWDGESLAAVGSQKAVCVNPLLGVATGVEADAKHAMGATNATGLEWGTEPPLTARKVSARCLGGLLFVDKPKSPAFKDAGTWEDRRKVNSYNLFYGDLEADMQARWQAFQTGGPPPLP